MSDLDSEDSQSTGWSDLESTLPHYSLVDSTIDLTPLGVNENTRLKATRLSANKTQNRITVIRDSNISGPAPNTGISVCYAPPRGTESDKGEEFLESPTQTTPRSKSPSFLPFHRGWSMDRGRGMGRGGVGKKLYNYTN